MPFLRQPHTHTSTKIPSLLFSTFYSKSDERAERKNRALKKGAVTYIPHMPPGVPRQHTRIKSFSILARVFPDFLEKRGPTVSWNVTNLRLLSARKPKPFITR